MNNISETNPIRLIDLNRYPLSEEDIHDKDLIKWTKEIIHTFTRGNESYTHFKNTVNKNVYTLPLNNKFSKYGARHFVMKDVCLLNDKEIDKLRKEATSIYSPYWYGMLSTCHHSGHISLRIAQLLFPNVKWRIIETVGHTFVTNMSVYSILTTFSDISPYSSSVDNMFVNKLDKNNNIQTEKEKIKEVNKLLDKIIIDKAEFDESAPMIIDILITDKKSFLELVGRTPYRYIRQHSNTRTRRNRLIFTGNIKETPIIQNSIIKKVPFMQKLKNYVRITRKKK